MCIARKGRLLELFKGTGSVGHVFEHNGYKVTSLDFERKWKPDICTDILKWDYKKAFKPGDFEVIWASPPCTEYSRALTTRPRNHARVQCNPGVDPVPFPSPTASYAEPSRSFGTFVPAAGSWRTLARVS